MRRPVDAAHRPRVGRILTVLLAIAAGLAGRAAGSFECLPGPVPGGISDWAGRGALDRPAAGRSWRGFLSLGRPAGVGDLAWTHGSVCRAIGSAHLSSEGYVLALEEVYREQVLGVWLGVERLAVGVRRWRVVWDDRLARSGWTGSVRIRIGLRQLRVAAGVQDLGLGRSGDAAPGMRVGGLATIQADPSLDLIGGVHRWRDRWGGSGGIRWRLTGTLALQEEIVFPEGSPRTALQIGADSPRIGLWFEPSGLLGWRLGITCSLGG